MSQARLPRMEPSTELITAHKANHRAAHVAGRAVGIFAKVRWHRVLDRQPFEKHRKTVLNTAANDGIPSARDKKAMGAWPRRF